MNGRVGLNRDLERDPDSQPSVRVGSIPSSDTPLPDMRLNDTDRPASPSDRGLSSDSGLAHPTRASVSDMLRRSLAIALASAAALFANDARALGPVDSAR